MANEVRIIVSATDKASATLSGVGNKIKTFSGGLNSTVKSLTGFSLGNITAVAAVGMVAKGIGDSIKLFTTYAEQVRTMSAATGMSNEETSKMIQVFDDANVEIGLFTAAARKMVQNGIQPSISNMAKLADEYVALQDPVAKSKLLLDNFGRSGLAMGKLMAGGSKGILESAEAAEKFGLVLDDRAIAAAEEYRIALDDMSDATEGLKIKLGKALIPALNKTVDAMNKAADAGIMLVDWNKNLSSAYEEHMKTVLLTAKSYEEFNAEQRRSLILIGKSTPLVVGHTGKIIEVADATQVWTKEQYNLTIGAKAFDVGMRVVVKTTNELGEEIEGITDPLDILKSEYSELSTILKGDLGPAQEEYNQSVEDLRLSTIDLQAQVDVLSSKKWLSSGQKQELADLNGQIEENKVKAGELAEAHDKATKQIILGFVQQAAAADGVITQVELDKIAALGKEWGLYDKATATAIENSKRYLEDAGMSVDEFNRKIGLTEESIGNAHARAEGFKTTWDKLKSKSITLTVNLRGNIPANKSISDIFNKQYGGPVVGGRPYVVGEAGPELFVPSSSGKIVPNNQIGRGGGSGAGISIGEINVYASESMDEQSLAQLVIARLAAATRNSGYAGLDYAG